MLIALLGLLVLQAFWIYNSVQEHNNNWKTKSKGAELKLKADLEEDYFCFMLSRITAIDLKDSLIVLNQQDTLGAYQYVTEDTSLTYPKNVFSYGVPMWVQLELRFDYLLDSLSQEQLDADTALLAMFNEYREDAVLDSVNGLRVAYRNSMHRIITENLAAIDWQDDFAYSVSHADDERRIYDRGDFEGKQLLLETKLYDNHQRFAQSYILRVYSHSPLKSVLSALMPLLIASVLIIFMAIILFVISLRSLRKERQLAKMRKDMMHSLSHEMNTPISNMSLAIQSLQKKEQINGPYLNILLEENSRLADNVARIMDYAQMEDKEIALDTERIELNNLLKKVLESYRSSMNGTAIAIDFFEANKDLWIKGDEKHLINVFYNLLGNATKYAGIEPRIEIHSDLKGKEVILNFMDNNDPIPMESRSRVFEKYYRQRRIT